jgi:dienelactone hydrolase
MRRVLRSRLRVPVFVLICHGFVGAIGVAAVPRSRPSIRQSSVGFSAITIFDRGRLFGAKNPRPIRLFVWYPCRAPSRTTATRFRAYVNADWAAVDQSKLGSNDPGAARKRFADLLADMGGRPFSTSEVEDMLDERVDSIVEAEQRRGRFPVVVLGTGLVGAAYFHTQLGERLARAGFVAIAVSSLGNAPGRTPSFDAAGIEAIARDIEEAIDASRRMKYAAPSDVGLAGWSVAGISEAIVAARRSDVAALASLDSGLGYRYSRALLTGKGNDEKPAGPRIAYLQVMGADTPGVRVDRDSAFIDAAVGDAYEIRATFLVHPQFTSFGVMASHTNGNGLSLREAYAQLADETIDFVRAYQQNDRGSLDRWRHAASHRHASP